MKYIGRDGFSIVQGLIFLAMTMILGLSLLQIKNSSIVQNQLLERKIEAKEVERIIENLISDDLNCNCMFQTTTWPAAATEISLNNLKNGCESGVNILTRGNQVRQGSSLVVSDIKLKNFSGDLGSGVKRADLVLNFRTDIGFNLPVVIRSRLFSVRSNRIAYCLTSGASSEHIVNCAINSKLYVGFNVTYNNQSSDANGCLPLQALIGTVGPVGPRGPRGSGL